MTRRSRGESTNSRDEKRWSTSRKRWSMRRSFSRRSSTTRLEEREEEQQQQQPIMNKTFGFSIAAPVIMVTLVAFFAFMFTWALMLVQIVGLI